METKTDYRTQASIFTVIFRKALQSITGILLLLSLISGAQAAGTEDEDSGKLLKCLGQAELRIHQQKLAGAIYQLNQELVNEVASWDKIQLKKRYVNQICEVKDFSPSVELLKVLLLAGEEAFNFEKHDFETESLKLYQIEVIRDFLDRIPKIFFSYLADLQSMIDNPKCLLKNVPELDYFFERYRYLESDVSTKQLIQTPEAQQKLKSIFQKLRNFDKIVSSC